MTHTSSADPFPEPQSEPAQMVRAAQPRTAGSQLPDAKGVQVGANNVQHNYFTGQVPVSWPHRVGVVPPLAHCHQTRPADAALAAAIDSSNVGTAVMCQVLAGMGGVGKTQLVANLAHGWWKQRRVDLLLWVNATARSDIVTAFAQAAADVTGAHHTDTDAEAGAARLLAWLAATDRHWLIVLDDLIDPDDLAGLWPPATATGRTVVTTRRRDAALLAGRQVINVDLFTEEQAVAYLTRKLASAAHLGDDLTGLGAELGWLPLALAQAAAFLLDRNLTCTGYRQRLATKQLRQLRPMSLPDQHRAIVAATWKLSVDLADQLTPPGIAGYLLHLAALLDPNGIPTTLFTTTPVIDGCTRWLGSPIDVDDIRDSLQVLHRLSLATLDPTSTTLRVHGLVQRAVGETLPEPDQAPFAVAAADAMLELWPSPERDAAHALALRANTAALRAAAESHLWTTQETAHDVLSIAGNSLGVTGLVHDAHIYFQHLHAAAVGQRGPDHADTLAIRHNVAYWQGRAGDLAGAAAAFKVLLSDYLRVLGPDHPHTFVARRNAAEWQGEAGDPTGALAEFEALLADQLRVLGPDHRSTLATRQHIAVRQATAGDLAEAFTTLEALLVDLVRVLGPDHPNTLTTRQHLATCKGTVGDAAGAFAAFEALLGDYLRVLGPDHPETFKTRQNMASWRGTSGDPIGAATAFEALLADQLRVLGPDHPDTLITRQNIAGWRGRIGEPTDALTAFEALLADQLRVLGPDHPHTLATRQNVAQCQGDAGDPAGAFAAFEALTVDYLRVLGPDHPHTLTARRNAADWLGAS